MSASMGEAVAVPQPTRSSRPYLYALDPLRGITALLVVLVHVLIFVDFHWRTERSLQLQDAGVVVTHVARNVFMFITAVTLTYVYAGKPFLFRRFWSRRSVGVFLPYALWSIVYAWINTPQPTAIRFARVVALDLITGQASYQLYYIGITLQFYLLLPLFLRFIVHVARWPWRTLAVGFIVQWLIMYGDYHYLLTGKVHPTGWLATLLVYRQNCVLLYPFYFIMGGLAAIHLRRVLPVLLRHGAWTVVGFFGMMAAVLTEFIIVVWIKHEPLPYVTAPIQPMALLYSIAVILCMCWLAARWAERRGPTGMPPGNRFFKELSDASFGVYLMHAMVLSAVAAHILPALPAALPGLLRVLIVWVLAAGTTAALSAALVHTPLLSRLVGRSQPLPRLRRSRELSPVRSAGSSAES
jgi:probable poly-beta-1,6-N-acetyl-D-glucosamine export protein